MAWNLAIAARNAAGDGLMGLLDTGGTATIQIREGTQPASADDTATGLLLATLTLNNPAWNSFVAGVGTGDASLAITSTIVGTGVAGHARLLNGDGTTHSDMDIAEGSGIFAFNDIDFVTGGTVSIGTMSITMPAS